jgi:hypothetical protein
MHLSVDYLILPPEQTPGTHVKARKINGSVDAISPTPDIVSRFAWIGEADPTEVGFRIGTAERSTAKKFHKITPLDCADGS